MKSLLITLIALFTYSVAEAQVAYNIPEVIKNDKISIEFVKVSQSSSAYYINYKITNVGDGILFIDRKKASIAQNKGSINPLSGTYTLNPGDTKTIYNEFRVKAPVKAKAEMFKLVLDGLKYANPSNKTIQTENLVVSEKATQTIKEFAVKVMEYKVYSDRKYAEIKATFNGNGEQIGKIDLTKLTVTGGKADIVKKGDALLPGKSYTWAINVKPNEEEFALNWNGVFNVMKVSEVKLDTIVIKSTSYKEPVAKEVKKEEKKKVKPVAKNCELSFSDFSALKADIKTEMNNGGKPVEMANEFLIEKGCISTAQVIEYLVIFNLDGNRLKFAKMAYKYTSDKNKYHIVVGKMAYTKNKQALEEFLEQQ